MSRTETRIRIENEILGRQEKKYSEEEQANHLMNLLMENYPLLSVSTIAFEPEGESVSVFAQRGLSGRFIKELYGRKSTPLITAAAEGEVLVAAEDSRAKDPSFRLEHEYKSLYAVRCRLQDETVGVFVADSREAGTFTPEIRSDFLAYARLSTLFLALRNLKAKSSRLPEVDAVTGLSSFKHFHIVLHRELSRGRKFSHPVALVFLKVRNLREMNEVYGHVPADHALAETAGRVRAVLREVDYVSRSGGNIYIVMPKMTKTDAAKVADELARKMDASPIGHGDIQLNLAIGVAAYPKDGDSERVLIPLAESMIRESIRKGGNAVTLYRD
jgi:diguanylate cyclase (GGDEF)-like protein